MRSTSSNDLSGSRAGAPANRNRSWAALATRAFGWAAGLAAAAAFSLLLAVGLALAVAYPNLPDVSALSDYRPKLPLRVYAADHTLIAEFGEERRSLTPIKEIPQVMIDAVLAIEDARFYSHSGVDYKGMVRAALANLGRIKSQGASTITMQVARNVYLSSEKTITRKIYEVLLTFKLEHLLSKDQILEIYMNQIYLGNRAFGFAAAAETYFGKPLKDVTVAEAAMLAGLPKAPATNNPIRNPERARVRQLYIVERMEQNGFITEEQAESARAEPLKLKSGAVTASLHADYVAETVRQLIFAQYGEQAYTRGLNVYTTLDGTQQEAAYKALRRGLMDYERRQVYRGPEKFVDLPANPKDLDDAVDEALADHPDNDDLVAAVVLSANSKKIVAMRQNGDRIEITGEGLQPARSGLADKAPPNIRIRRGAIIRAVENARKNWEITQLPEVEGALVSLDPRDGAIKALVGGFRLRQKQVQPRDAGLAPARFVVQAVHLLGRARKRIHAEHGDQRRAAVLRRLGHGRPAVGAEELRRRLLRPDVNEKRARAFQEHGVDPDSAGDRPAVRAELDHAVRVRCRQASGLSADGAGLGRGDTAADGPPASRYSPTAVIASTPG